jgi:hypothetical protein
MDFDDRPTIAEVEAFRTVYYFFHDRLYMIRSTLPGQSYPDLRKTFTDKYGSPEFRTVQYQNSSGAKADGEKLLWKTAISQISIGERDGQPDDPFMTSLKDSAVRIAATEARTAAIGNGYEATKTATVYGQVLNEFRGRHRQELSASNVLIVIWDTALRNECDAAGSTDRKKDI